MQKTKGGGKLPGSPGRNEKHRTVVSDLESVIEQVRKSLKLIESEIASETAFEETAGDDIVVLDDVTPGYARAHAVLRECDAGLTMTLQLLQETSGQGCCEFVVEGDPLPAH
ncbi:MAG TPA: hypothetical protein VJR30_00880 [Bradyrhizobium sp.]|nr:hypothetical protein [Bradyrhizobium sp.]